MPATEQQSALLCVRCSREYYSSLRPSGIESCLTGKSATLGFIRNTYGEDSAIAFIMTAILDYLELVGDTRMTPGQMRRCADEIFTAYWNMNAADVKLVFSRLLRKEQYGAVNAGKIISAFDAYWRERLNTADEMSYAEHMQNTAGESNTPRIAKVIPLKNKIRTA